MIAKSSRVYFIDRINYAALFGRDFGLSDITKLSQGLGDPQKVSSLTQAIVCELNTVMNKVLFDTISSCYPFSLSLSNQDRCYTEHYVRSFLSPQREDIHYVVAEDKKYYEIVVLPDNTLLVVVENGFLTFVTESKDNFLKFILDCLCYQYKFNLTNSLFKTYVSLKLNDNYFQLIKSRFN